MSTNLSTLPLLAVLVLGACAGSPSLHLAEVQRNDTWAEPPADSVAVLALYPDGEFELRALVENAFVKGLVEEGVEATPGYRFFDEYEGLLEGVGVEAAARELLDAEIDAVVFVDPIRAKAFDPGEYAARRSAYRSLGMDSSASIALLNQLAAEADAAKVVMEVSLWSPHLHEFGWAGTYDINAPQGYDYEVIKGYAAEFAGAVAHQLRQDGLLE